MMKQNKIYQMLRQEILTGVWKPGEKLPTETEYARRFNIARNTLRAGLKKLEDEGFIERIKSKGTFVKLPKVSQEEKNISLLVPCCEYLQYIGIHDTKIMFELIAEAAAVGWRVTPVVFSRTNDPKDIWWENLSHFNQDSRIVVNRKWFAPYFEKLAGIGAFVAFISNDSSHEDRTSRFTSKWMNFIEEDKVAARKAFRFLKEAGCRKIALAMPETGEPDNSLCREYRELARSAHMEETVIDLAYGDDDPDGAVRSAYKREKFDGLIFHCNELKLSRNRDFRAGFGLPEDFPMVAIPNKMETVYPAENIPVIEYRIRELAHDIVQHLTGGQRIPGRKSYAPKLTLCGREIVLPED